MQDLMICFTDNESSWHLFTTTEVGIHVACAISFGKLVPLLEEFFLNVLKVAVGNRFKTKLPAIFVCNKHSVLARTTLSLSKYSEVVNKAPGFVKARSEASVLYVMWQSPVL